MDPKGNIDINEPAPEMSAGFLSELWQSATPLARIEGAEKWIYYLRRGVDNILALPMSNAVTVFTIAISLFLFAGFILLLQNIERVIASAGNTVYVTAYLKENAPDKQVTDFVQELEKSPQVRSVKYISKKDALDLFRDELGSRGGFLNGVEQDNPLPASIELILHPDELRIGNTSTIIQKLRDNPLLEEVIYGGEWVEKTQAVLRTFRIIGYVGLLIVLGVILLLIANTIKLVIYARRDEIAIMQLVGATDSFVKVPFIVGGMIQGVLGSIIGLFLLKGAFSLLSYQIENSTLLGVTLPEFHFLTMSIALIVISIGFGIGAIGSYFALGRFMNV